ncbi:MAG: DNA repair protein RecO [Myxococcales bacterium]|nr:DNA repair protein RecO [Myxococcales bacterium]MCB9712863.1 DNA repair protein RecO [Myxococcales bacterium]
MGVPGERSPAVVLATRALGEADLLVVLLTPGRGKVRAAARHARKSRRRFPGGIGGGSVGEATLALRSGGLSRLESFVPARDHGALGRDLTRFAYVAYLCELTDALVHEPEPDPELFSALCEAIARTMDEPPRAVVLRRYELRLLRSLGLLPALDQCAVCGEPLAPGPTVPLDDARGGTLCLQHGKGAPRRPAPQLAAAQRLLEAAADADVDQALAEVEAQPPMVRRGLRDLAMGWVRGHLRRPLRSREFFAKLGPGEGRPGDDS